MRYAAERANLRKQIANADSLSPSYIARIYGLPQPSGFQSPRPPKQQAPQLERIEVQALKTMPVAQKEVYLLLREAAMDGDYAPTYESLMECCGSEKTAATTLRRLEGRGAITRRPARKQNRPMVYRLPWIDRETKA